MKEAGGQYIVRFYTLQLRLVQESPRKDPGRLASQPCRREVSMFRSYRTMPGNQSATAGM